MKIASAVVAAFTVSLVGYEPAFAQTAPPHEPIVGECHSREEVVATLAFWKEVSKGEVLVEQTGTLAEIFISPRGTLSVVEVLPDGLTCYRAFNSGEASAGRGWGAKPANTRPASFETDPGYAPMRRALILSP